jgi:hypothetical protein
MAASTLGPRLAVLAAAVAVGLALAGCSSATGPTSSGAGLEATPIPTVGPGSSGGGPASTPGSTSLGTPLAVHMTLPSNWKEVTLTDAAIQAQIDALGSSNAQVAAALRQMLQTGQYHSIRFYALGYRASTIIGNVNVSTAQFGTFGLDTTSVLYENQLQTVGATGVTMTDLTLPAGQAVLVSYALPVKGASVNLTGRSYLILKAGWGYVTTFSCYESDPTACLNDAGSMIQTLTIGP